MIGLISLAKFISLKRVSPYLKQWIKPMWLLSIGIHAAILMMPISESPLPVKPKPTEKPRSTVKIRAIPTAKVKPKSIIAPIKSNPIPQSKSVTKPAKYSLPAPVKTQKVTQRTTPSTPKASSSPKPLSPIVPSDGTTYDPKDPWNDFPLFAKGVSGYFGSPSCYSTTQSLEEVTNFFTLQLSKKMYGVELVSPPDERDRKVYQVERNGKTQFLNVLLDAQTTVYALTEKSVLSLDDLENAIQIPPDFYRNILEPLSANAAVSPVTPDKFTKPFDFYLSVGGEDNFGTSTQPAPKPETDNTFKLATNHIPQQVFEKFFQPKFSELQYQSKPIPMGYSGGLLYEVSKITSKPFYLNLVPTKDKTGTIIVVWRNKPA